MKITILCLICVVCASFLITLMTERFRDKVCTADSVSPECKLLTTKAVSKVGSSQIIHEGTDLGAYN